LLLAPRTDVLSGFEIHHLKLHGVLSATTGEGLPFISVQPHASASVTLVYLDPELEKNVHFQLTLRTG
jgi:hypothetical protein